MQVTSRNLKDRPNKFLTTQNVELHTEFHKNWTKMLAARLLPEARTPLKVVASVVENVFKKYSVYHDAPVLNKSWEAYISKTMLDRKNNVKIRK